MRNKSTYLYFLIIPLYLVVFIIAESVVDKGTFVSYLPIDDKIPFIDFFVIPYVMWYPFMFWVGIKLFIKDVRGFKGYMSFLGIAFFSIIILNMIFPNEQNLRVDITVYDSIYSRAVALIYKIDTNTNVCPSMHAVGTIGAFFALLKSKSFKRTEKIFRSQKY